MRIIVTLWLLLLALPCQAGPIRIKDLVEFDGVRGNDLVGYGLVVGLLLGYALIRAEVTLTGGAGGSSKGGRRAEDQRGVRPEPPRSAALL